MGKKSSRIFTRLKIIYKRIDKKLQSPQGREFFTFLGFVILAAGFWLILSISENREHSVRIPIKLTNIPPETVLLNDPPQYVEARIRDKGPIMLGYTLNKVPPIEINFTQHDNNKDALVISNNNILEYTRQQLKSTTSILAFTPDSIRINYTHDQGRRIPVSIQGAYTTMPHCILGDSITTSPDSVMVYGKASTIRTIDKVYTEEFMLDSLSDTTTISIHLKPIPGTRIIPDTTTITIPVEEFTTKVVSVPIAIANIPQGYSVMTFPSHIQLTCMIPISQYSKVSGENFLVGIDYNTLLKQNNSLAPVTVAVIPPYVRNITLSQDSIEYIINEIANIAPVEKEN